MAAETSISPRRKQSLLSCLGVVLMLASFVWLQLTSEPAAPVYQQQPAAKNGAFPVVVIDPGHGGQDSGATMAGVLEKDLTLDVAQRVDRVRSLVETL